MKKLGERNVLLISQGVKVTGSFEEGYFYSEESFYVNEADDIFEFCLWVDKEIGGGSSHNMELLFKAFKNPEDKKAVDAAMSIKHQISRIRSITNR
jgi:hypothetical protein